MLDQILLIPTLFVATIVYAFMVVVEWVREATAFILDHPLELGAAIAIVASIAFIQYRRDS